MAKTLKYSAGVALVATMLTGCGAITAKKAASSNSTGSGDAAAANNVANVTPIIPNANATSSTQTGTTVLKDAGLTNLVAHSPEELGLEILAAFGPSMTQYNVNGTRMDYLEVNSDLFTGAISGTASSTIPAQLESISYFMAVAALSQIVGQNYSAALAGGVQGAVAHDCTKLADAKAMFQALYPPATADEQNSIGPLIVTACTTDGAAAGAQALVESYTTLLYGG